MVLTFTRVEYVKKSNYLIVLKQTKCRLIFRLILIMSLIIKIHARLTTHLREVDMYLLYLRSIE